MNADKILDYLSAGFPLIYIETHEANRLLADLTEKIKGEKEDISTMWDHDRGLYSIDASGRIDVIDSSMGPKPAAAIDATKSLKEFQKIVFKNFHLFWKNPLIIQKLLNAIPTMKSKGQGIIIIGGPGPDIPPELSKAITVLSYDLPTTEQRKELTVNICKGAEMDCPEGKVNEAAAAGSGLVFDEYENALALTLVQNDGLSTDQILSVKEQIIKKNSVLELESKPDQTMDKIAGMNNLRDFVTRTIQSSLSKGIMLLGVPGCAKSTFAKALGNHVGLPTIRMDLGRVFGSLVGQSEQQMREALNAINAMAPCVVMIDEIEKGLAGASGNGSNDSGVTSRVFGTFLSWLPDRPDGIYVIATCNGIENLKPEFLRAERWDGIFFIDIPTIAERADIFKIFLKEYDLVKPKELEAKAQSLAIATEGYVGAEIKTICRNAKMMSIPPSEAIPFVIPLMKSQQDKINQLREWAKHRTIPATTLEVSEEGATVRKINVRKGA